MPDIKHPEMVATLVKPGAVIAAEMEAAEADLWHGATGVAGETTEILEAVLTHIYEDTPLDYENMVEELGDMEFYLEQVRQNLGIGRCKDYDNWAATDTLSYVTSRLVVSGGALLDLAKKVAIYKKDRLDLITDFTIALANIEWAMAQIRRITGITYEQAIAGNIAKLGVRYAGFKYTDNAAQVRADKKDAA